MKDQESKDGLTAKEVLLAITPLIAFLAPMIGGVLFQDVPIVKDVLGGLSGLLISIASAWIAYRGLVWLEQRDSGNR